jgi:hypothetical protein
MTIIKIDNIKCDFDKLSDEAKAQLVSMQFCDQELQRLQAQSAEVLEIAYKAAPTEQEHWVRLLAAQHHSGNLARCRELIALGEGLMPKELLK